MAILCTVVQAFVGTMFQPWRYRPLGRTIGAQFVRHNSPRQTVTLDQALQELFRRPLVALGLQDFIQHGPVLVRSPPKPVHPFGNLQADLVQMPDITRTRLPAAQTSSDLRTKLDHPPPEGFVCNVGPLIERHFLDFAQAEIEADAEPDRLADNLSWETVALIAD